MKKGVDHIKRDMEEEQKAALLRNPKYIRPHQPGNDLP